MVRACPNQNVTLAYLVCVHVAVREPIHRDLLSPSTLWVLRLSICPAICTLACPSICLSAGLFCAICLPIFVPHCSFTCLSWPSSCPVAPLSPSVCLPSPCTPVCRISLLVPLHPIHSTSLHPFMCPSVCLEHPSCLRLLIIFHSNLPKHFSRPDRLRCPMPALQRGRSAYSYWLNCPSLKQFLPPPSSLCLDGVIYIVN